MTVQDISFYSDGLRLDGLLHQRPGGGRAPVLLVCSGLHGLKEWVPAKWAPYALAAGFDVLKGHDEVDPERIALLGWGLGAGIAIAAAARDPEVAAVVSANGAGDYGRTVHNATEYPRLLRWQDRLRQDRL